MGRIPVGGYQGTVIFVLISNPTTPHSVSSQGLFLEEQGSKARTRLTVNVTKGHAIGDRK
jgi:hypothetical protein